MRRADRNGGFVAALALALLLSPACRADKEKSGGEPALATVTGQLVGPTGAPIAGAAVSSEGGVLATTGPDGAFTVALAAGAHRLTFTKDGDVVALRCVAVAELTEYLLGAISIYTPSSCAAAAGGAGDADGDGLTDGDEESGWDVRTVDGDGVVRARLVTSDPASADTDGDGIADAEERAAGIDPRRKDTDADLLSDLGELTVFKSDPRNADSDADSRGPTGLASTDPNLWDGNELTRSHTSPTLADTDGDGLTDWEEIHSGGTNPLVADLPALALEAYGDPRISLDVASVTGCDSSSTSLAQDTTEQKDTDLSTNKMSVENTVKLHTETKAGTSSWPPSFNAKLTTDTEFKQAWMHETSSSFTATSVRDSQKRASCWETKAVDWAGGDIGLTMKLRNLSDLTFKVKDLNVIAYQLRGGGRFSLVGSLDPVNWTPGGYVLGPSGELVLEVKKTDLGAEIMQSLTRTPSALFFEVGSYSLFQLDEFGVNETVNYAKLGESVVQRTGLLTVDTGEGPAERYSLATNVYRNPDGSGRGVTLASALATLGIPYQTEVQKGADGTVIGKKVLKSVHGVSAYQPEEGVAGRGLWVVAGNGAAFAATATPTDFEDIVLRNGERVSLVYLRDTDLDGVFDREEALLGTDARKADTDDDGLTEYQETKEGWGVETIDRSYAVYPDPRVPDYDGDYLSDGTEKGMGTDPYQADTDGDLILDTNDPNPLDPPCLAGADAGVAAWWSGAISGTIALDAWTGDSPGAVGFANNASLVGGVTIASGPRGSAFSLNPQVDLATQYLEVPHHATLSPSRELSFSVYVFRNSLASYPDRSTVLAKGGWNDEHYALYLTADGKAEFVVRRQVHRTCWYCWFGSACDNGSCADDDYLERSVAATTTSVVTPGTWTLLTATFGGELMRLYKDGVEVASYDTSVYWADGWYRYETTTTYPITNVSPLRIGISAPGGNPARQFSGMVDDVQFFTIGLTQSQARSVSTLGVCPP